MTEFSTPMMQQYTELKNKYSDCILLFRLGDFYEMFMDDAKLGSDILDITLTSRDRGKDGRVPMCGVPFHALDAYLFKLVRAGYKVAICEQLTAPIKGEKLVERDVVRIVTPGTILDESSLEKKENNFIVGINVFGDIVGVAVADVSTGVFEVSQFPLSHISQVIVNELAKFNPTECVLPVNLYNDAGILKGLKVHRNLNIFPFIDWEKFSNDSNSFLVKHFGVKSLDSFGIEKMLVAQKAAAGLLGYLKYTQKDRVSHIKKISVSSDIDHLSLDRSTIMNLELFSTIREGNKNGSVINFLDNTHTSMGGRLLRNWLLKPLNNKELLEQRYDALEVLIKDFSSRETLKNILTEISDIERITSRLATGIGSPKDVMGLKSSLGKTEEILEELQKFDDVLLQNLQKSISKECLNLSKYISTVLVEDPPFDPKSGNLVNAGVDKEIDNLKAKIKSSKDFIATLEIQEKNRTGINSLKVKFNQVFGYYIEISKSNLHLAPKDYIRKQTLVNAERFITPDLKVHEEIILTAEETMKEMEYKKFLEVVSYILDFTREIQVTAHAVAELDCLINFSEISLNGNYVRPEIIDTGEIKIVNGKHPVVEKNVESGTYIPNDTYLNSTDHQLLIITGPNMAGKSVYIRQVALLVLLAQMGCFIPATSAQISLVDKIFVRSGASDVITMGLSTFMVEMIETANILNNATSESLIVMDEIGRGTSTYDGISIAWSVAEHLVNNGKISPKTLFATHYHELQDLEEEYPDKIKNYQVAVEENEGDPVFLHKVKPGAAAHSFGIAVAKLAGVPPEVCARATKILSELQERSHLVAQENETSKKSEAPKVSSEIVQLLNSLDITNTTPIEALNILDGLKRKINV